MSSLAVVVPAKGITSFSSVLLPFTERAEGTGVVISGGVIIDVCRDRSILTIPIFASPSRCRLTSCVLCACEGASRFSGPVQTWAISCVNRRCQPSVQGRPHFCML